MRKFSLFFITLFFWLNVNAQLYDGFVYIEKEIPSIKVELRYFSTNNFVGKPINGYFSNTVILTKETVKALKKIQKILSKKHISIKIYDAYRPQTAVNHFWEWAKKLEDTIMKLDYYPRVEKKNLFNEGYIATRSGHSRGSTVDLTTNKELDMGTPYDFFGPES